MFTLSERSRINLKGVNSKLVDVVEQAIGITTVDFGVVEGVRTVERQQQLYAKGATQTMKSKHLTGDAVDLVAYMDGRVSWELSLYDEIADAMKKAAKNLNVPVRWGGAWHIPNICAYDDAMECAMCEYIDQCRMQGRRPFLDGPHFELAG